MNDFKLTADNLVAYAKNCMETPHLYLWDGNGEYLTHELLDSLIEKYDYWYTQDRIAVRRSLCNRGIRGWDCIGLIKSFVWHDYHQGNRGFYHLDSDFCTRTLAEEELVCGGIASLPEKPGLVLMRKGHVGIYIGQEEIIECSIYNPLTQEQELIGGVIKRPLLEEEWSIWLQYPGIIY